MTFASTPAARICGRKFPAPCPAAHLLARRDDGAEGDAVRRDARLLALVEDVERVVHAAALFAHALIRAEYVKMFASTPSVFISATR